jgi:predicted PurR-regulated permease PerM
MSQADGVTETERANATERPDPETEMLRASVKISTVAQIIIAVAALIGLIYLLKLVLVTILSAILLAYVLEPPVGWLAVLGLPRWTGALIVVLLALSLVAGLGYFSYNRAVGFVNELPHYSEKLHEALGKFRSRVNQVEKRARSAIEPQEDGRRQPIAVKLEQPPGLTRVITESGGTILDMLLAMGFIPFLVYFMLATADHLQVATVRLFPEELRLAAHHTIGNISAMIRTFIVADVLVALINTTVFTLLFWILGIKYFYFIGAISGFVNLIPYLGVFLALLPPFAGGIGTLDKAGFLYVTIAVIGMHLLTTNLVYPKFIGERLQLNPLAVSISLLFWAWIWGAPGLVLAIPLLGATKIICDRIEPLNSVGSWLGNSS